jgi:hypothetical protein
MLSQSQAAFGRELPSFRLPLEEIVVTKLLSTSAIRRLGLT